MAEVHFKDTVAGSSARYPGAAAYAAVRAGFLVFPLTPEGTPALKHWPRIATRDLQQLQDWWTGEFRNAGYGIACGPESGVWVLDIDVKHGIDGFATLCDITADNDPSGASNDLLTGTMWVTTPSGGMHMYFRWVDGVMNSTGAHNRLGPGLDVRADHGYVRGPGWGGYQITPRNGIRSARLGDAPAWLTALAAAPSRRKGAGSPNSSALWRAWDTEQTIDRLRHTPEGGRNIALNKASYFLARAGVLSEDTAWKTCKSVLEAMGAGDNMPAWRRTFESGWNAGTQHRLEDQVTNDEQKVMT